MTTIATKRVHSLEEIKAASLQRLARQTQAAQEQLSRTLDLQVMAHHHPFVCIASAFVAGFSTTALLAKRSRARRAGSSTIAGKKARPAKKTGLIEGVLSNLVDEKLLTSLLPGLMQLVQPAQETELEAPPPAAATT